MSSKYRQAVVAELGEGPTNPSQIASNNGVAPPHISRALGELAERGIVESHGSGSRSKLYSLTAFGEEVLAVVDDTSRANS